MAVFDGNWWSQRGNDLIAPYKGIANSKNPLDALLRFVDSGNRIPQTTTVTSYALTLHARVGNRSGPIGAVHEFSHTQALAIDEEFDVDRFGSGRPRALIPQNTNGRTLTLQRYDLYGKMIEQVFGGPTALVNLNEQFKPIYMRLSFKTPSTTPLYDSLKAATQDNADEAARKASALTVYQFCDCYLTNLGRQMSASNNIIVGSNATITWRYVMRVA
jgi:hypothetical protein